MVVAITDLISATQLPQNESFSVFASAKNLEVLRGCRSHPWWRAVAWNSRFQAKTKRTASKRSALLNNLYLSA